jgi:flagellar protein FlaG
MDIRSMGNGAATGQRILETGTHTEASSLAAKQSAAAVQTANAVDPSARVPSMDQLDDAIKKINETMKSLSQNVEFSVDADSNRTIVKVVEYETGQVIRQMPSPEALEIAKAMDRLQGLLIRQKA